MVSSLKHTNPRNLLHNSSFSPNSISSLRGRELNQARHSGGFPSGSFQLSSDWMLPLTEVRSAISLEHVRSVSSGGIRGERRCSLFPVDPVTLEIVAEWIRGRLNFDEMFPEILFLCRSHEGRDRRILPVQSFVSTPY